MQSEKRHKLPSSIDRISDLSDAILCHILSFLPTERSVATSILSRRWRFLWAYAPTLDFEFWYSRSRASIGLSDIIHRVMLLHRVHKLNTFRLTGYYEFSKYQIETWITIAISRAIRNLDIDLDVMLPRCLFTCTSLVELRLGDCVCGGMAGAAVLLPRLKKLHLYYVRYGSDDFFAKLISGCPVLEELVVDKILQDDVNVCCISSPTLAWLSVFSDFDDCGDMESEYRLEINAPSLRYLKVEDSLSTYISAGELTSLIEADLELAEYEDSSLISVLEFVARLCNVKCLRLSTHYVEFTDILFAESRFGRTTIRFDNLSKLDLAADWNFLSRFLEIADNLEVLIVHVYECKEEEQIIWKAPQQVPTCLLSHLRTVTINRFGSTKSEFEMVSYLLKNAEVLQMMEIHSRQERYEPPHKIDKFKALQKISQFPRGSKTCELHFD